MSSISGSGAAPALRSAALGAASVGDGAALGVGGRLRSKAAGALAAPIGGTTLDTSPSVAPNEGYAPCSGVSAARPSLAPDQGRWASAMIERKKFMPSRQ